MSDERTRPHADIKGAAPTVIGGAALTCDCSALAAAVPAVEDDDLGPAILPLVTLPVVPVLILHSVVPVVGNVLGDHGGDGVFRGRCGGAGDPGALAPTAQFSALDGALQSAIDRLRNGEREATTEAYRSTSLLSVGAVVIGVLAGFAVGGGIWPRLNEYH